MLVAHRGIGIVGLFAIAFLIWAGQTIAASNFVKISLSNGVTVELPSNWIAMSDNKRITLGAWNESVLAARKLSDVENELPFAANYYDDRGNAAGTFAIRYYPAFTITQSEAIAANALDVKELDAGLRQTVGQGIEASGGKMVAWLGTTKKSINGNIYFISEDRLLTPRGDVFRGFLVRYLNAGKSFTIMISYREDQEYYLRPICDRIISSIRN